MAFGIPGSDDTTQTGPFLGRLQYDARVGFWKYVKRAQQSDGAWEDEASEPFKNPAFLLDLQTLEVGFIKFASPPSFMVVPYGSTIPPRPAEKMKNDAGQDRNAYLPGFRCKVYNPKMFGDANAYYFANNSKTVLNPMDELYTLATATAEAKAGKVPLIRVTGTSAVKIEGPKGTNTYYAPIFTIAGWHDRPEIFGPRTVGVTAPVSPMKTNGGARHVHAPVANAPENDWSAGPQAGHPVNAPPPADDGLTDDDIPF